jgi:hypothetical protein
MQCCGAGHYEGLSGALRKSARPGRELAGRLGRNTDRICRDHERRIVDGGQQLVSRPRAAKQNPVGLLDRIRGIAVATRCLFQFRNSRRRNWHHYLPFAPIAHNDRSTGSRYFLPGDEFVPSFQYEPFRAVLAILPDFAIFHRFECFYSAIFAAKVGGIEDVEHLPSSKAINLV